MTLQEILASLLNPGGSQQANQLSMAGAPPAVGDHNNPGAMLGGPPQQAIQPPQQPMAPPPAPQGQPMPQGAPMAPQQAPEAGQQMAAPSPAGGGIGGFLSNLLHPQDAGKNQTIAWLQKQGMDQGTATMFASSKPALQQYLMQRSQGKKPIEIAGRLVDPTDYHVIADFSEKKQREVRNDSNGVPRYVDSGEAVYASDNSSGGGTGFFSGKGVEAQGLNYLIDQGKLTKEQAANVAAGKQVTGPNGEIIFMTPQGIFQQAPGGGGTQPVVPGVQPDQGGNIPITGPKYSEDMRKSLGFANKAEQADAILVKPNVEAAAESGWENFKAGVPLIHNKIVSNDYQSFDQAQRNFINSVLRRESGAAISESEFDNARRQYLPQWGDSPELIQQKADNRRTAIEGLHQSGDAVPSMSGGSMGGGTVPAADQILQMPKDQLDKLIPNIKTMTPEQRKAAERRWDELNK